MTPNPDETSTRALVLAYVFIAALVALSVVVAVVAR